ncbi:MAG: AMIN domain-containing protein [Desulfobulbaceae bacterium]|nr:AMIN domain-containing protein [Desulfobulbaceae bacterium]
MTKIMPVFSEESDSCSLLLKTYQPISAYNSFLLVGQNRLVIDVAQAEFARSPEDFSNACRYIERTRAVHHPDKVRLWFYFQGENKADYSVDEVKDGLLLTVKGGKKAPLLAEEKIIETRDNVLPANVQEAEEVSASLEQLLDDIPERRVSLHFFKDNVQDFFKQVASLVNLQIVVNQDCNAPLTMDFQDVPLRETIMSVLRIYNLQMQKQGEVFFISSADTLPPGQLAMY